MSAHLAILSASRKLVTKSRADIQSYYRSKILNFRSPINMFVAAAQSIFAILERLQMSDTLPPIKTIRDNLEHELKAFLSQFIKSGNTDEHIALAYYLLCATVDELVAKSYLRLHKESVSFRAFTPVSVNNSEPKTQFFLLLEHMKQSPQKYLDLLELVYFCLTLGFEGEKHEKANGRQELENTIEDLYQIIINARIYKPSPHKASEKKETPLTPKPSTKNWFANKLWVLTGGTITIITLASLAISHYMLDNQAKDILLQQQYLLASSKLISSQSHVG